VSWAKIRRVLFLFCLLNEAIWVQALPSFSYFPQLIELSPILLSAFFRLVQSKKQSSPAVSDIFSGYQAIAIRAKREPKNA
jgi:hypothetical protein